MAFETFGECRPIEVKIKLPAFCFKLVDTEFDVVETIRLNI